jgi:PAS domain-containing protein
MTNNKNDFFESKKFIKTIVARLPERIYWKDKNGVYRGCNDTFARSLGYTSPDDIIGKTDDDLIGNVKSETLRQCDECVMKTEEVFVTE